MAGRALEAKILEVLKQRQQPLPDSELASLFPDVDAQTRVGAINKLSSQQKVSLLRDPKTGNLSYKYQNEEEALKLKNLTPDDLLVLQSVAQSKNVGIWTKELKYKTNLPQPQITKSLKELEKRKLIKAVKSVANANRKVYMLFTLEPARAVSGGTWYTEHEYDADLVASLQKVCYSFISQRGEVSLADIHKFIDSKNVVNTKLRAEDVEELLEVLDMDCKIERVDGEDGMDKFRKVTMELPTATAFSSMPCGVCPVFNECTPGGRISPQTCVYFKQWLDF